MAEPRVTTSTRLLSDEVALARASQEIDAIGPGSAGVVAIQARNNRRPGYEFSNGVVKKNSEYGA